MMATRTEGLWGWAAGGYAQWGRRWEKVSLLTETWWIEKGYSRRLGGNGALVETRDRYLSFPLLLLYDRSKREMRPFSFAGPSIECLISDGIEEGLPRWSVAINVGGGIRYRQRLEFRIRYTQDITDSSGAGPSGHQRVRNRGVVLTSGLRFTTE
jgi:hypothetical protein